MTKHESVADLWAEAEKDEVFWTEKNKLDFAIKLFHTMKRRRIAKKELAERLGTSQAYITKVFRGDANFTLASMTKLVQAVDARLAIQIVPKEENVKQWFRVLETKGEKKLIPSRTRAKKLNVESSSISGKQDRGLYRMMATPPPLELIKYFFPYVQVAADADYEPSENEIEANFEVRTTISQNEDETDDVYQVVVEIIAEPENENSRIPYAIHLIAVGPIYSG